MIIVFIQQTVFEFLPSGRNVVGEKSSWLPGGEWNESTILLSPKSGEPESSNAVYRIYEMSMSMVTGAFYMNNWLGPISDMGLERPLI